MKLRNKGFTLVEIIVVLFIMGVLLAVAVPAILGYVDDSKKATYLPYGRSINEEVRFYVEEQRAANTNQSFDNLLSNLEKELSWGQYNILDQIVTSDIPEGYSLHSADLCFDNQFSDAGWVYDSTLSTHTLTKVSIWFAKYDSVGQVNDAIFVVTLLNQNMYVYDSSDFNAAVGKDNGPIINR